MTTDLTQPASRAALRSLYRDTLLQDVIPFWLRHGLDREHGGILTCLDRDGSVIDTDKSVWFQGRSAWMFATLARAGGFQPPPEPSSKSSTAETNPALDGDCKSPARAECLAASRSCIEFIRQHCYAPDGKMFFTVTREGRPLRMRRYVYSESFAAIANAAYAKASGDARAAEEIGRAHV